MAPSARVKIEYVRLSDLEPAPRNPKEHDLGAIHSSIARFGFTAPLLIDERTGRLVAGHGRLAALQQMRQEGATPPARIAEKDGDWLVPIVRGVGFNSDDDAEAYLIADNRLTELGGWDDPVLLKSLQELAENDALEGVGYDTDDLDALFKQLAPGAVGWGDAAGDLPSDDRESFQQMTFTLHDTQVEIVKKAMAEAIAAGPFDGPNENKNGNALERICNAFLGHGES